MRIYQPQNQYGQDLLSTADVVESIKTITKAISNGKVEITAADLGTDKASDWTVLEVVYGGNKMMTGVTSTDAAIVVTLDDAGSTFTGDVVVTLAYEGALNVTEDAQQPPVVKRGEIRGLVNAYQSPFKEGPITAWDCNLPDLTDGSKMFIKCSNLTLFSGDMPALTNGEEMFYYCDSLTSFSGDLSALTNGEYMFNNCTNLASFSGDLSALSNGQSMFYQCSNLTSFSGDLSALSNGQSMFDHCTNLASFSADMPALTDGSYMFWVCDSLTSFSGDLSALNNGTNMFSGCSKLTSWTVDLPALTNGDYMFLGCNLDESSILRILNSIPEYTSGTHRLHLGKNTNFKNSTEVASKLGVSTPIAATTSLKYKGWTITITN